MLVAGVSLSLQKSAYHMHNLPSLSSSGDFLYWKVVGDCCDCFSSFSRPSAVV